MCDGERFELEIDRGWMRREKKTAVLKNVMVLLEFFFRKQGWGILRFAFFLFIGKSGVLHHGVLDGVFRE